MQKHTLAVTKGAHLLIMGILATAIAVVFMPTVAQTQFTSPIASITANLSFDGGTTGTINTTGANLLVACVSSQGNASSPPTLSDSKSNSWTLAASSLGARDGHTRLFYSVPTSVGAAHTFTIAGAGTLASINVMAWAGAAASPLDRTAGAFAIGTSAQPGSVLPAQNNELLISCLSNHADTSTSSRSINGSFTISGQVGDSTNPYGTSLAGAYLVQTTAAATNPTWTYSVDTWANVVIATFKTVGAGGGGDDLASKPLFAEADLQRVGGFKTPDHVDNEYSGEGLGFYNDPTHGDTLYMTVKFYGDTKVMQINIPQEVDTSNAALMNVATLRQEPVDPTDGTWSEAFQPGAMGNVRLWGLQVYGGKLLASAFAFYSGNETVSHFARSLNLSLANSLEGWKGIWDSARPRYTSGPMAEVPDYARAALGGPMLATGAGLASLNQTLSNGMAAFAFDPAQITGRTQSTLAAQPLIYFDYPAHIMVPGHDAYPGGGGGTNDPNGLWNFSTAIGGVVIPEGYRTLLYIGSHGYGDYCYGQATSDPDLHGDPKPGGGVFCYDPTNGSQGVHAYPYRYQVWAYDLLDLKAVKDGVKQPWDVMPYDTWELQFTVPIDADDQVFTGNVAYDRATKSMYISQLRKDPANYVARPIIWKFTHP